MFVNALGFSSNYIAAIDLFVCAYPRAFFLLDPTTRQLLTTLWVGPLPDCAWKTHTDSFNWLPRNSTRVLTIQMVCCFAYGKLSVTGRWELNQSLKNKQSCDLNKRKHIRTSAVMLVCSSRSIYLDKQLWGQTLRKDRSQCCVATLHQMIVCDGYSFGKRGSFSLFKQPVQNCWTGECQRQSWLSRATLSVWTPPGGGLSDAWSLFNRWWTRIQRKWQLFHWWQNHEICFSKMWQRSMIEKTNTLIIV